MYGIIWWVFILEIQTCTGTDLAERRDFKDSVNKVLVVKDLEHA